MTPIRASERRRYPADWPQIRETIRERAGGRCECDGRCRSQLCSRHSRQGRCTAMHGQPHPATGSRVVFTVAHLDHTPEHNDPANLRAMCQACHLAYDTEHHAATRRASAISDEQQGLF